jgi:hypothetical protein
MALYINQEPPLVSLVQSPMPITLEEDTPVITSSSFQYMLDLYYWTGAPADSGSSKYTLVKYPNTNGVGIFDVSRILNSTLTELLEASQGFGVLKFAKGVGYWEYLSGSTYVTSSQKVETQVLKYIDGYQLFPEPIGEDIYELTPHWPLMTSGPATQSVFTTNVSNAGVFVGYYDFGNSQATKIIYSSSIQVGEYALYSTTGSDFQINPYPNAPSDAGFPLSGSFDFYTIQAVDASGSNLGTPIRYNITCNQKYPNIRVKWKNRFGQFDSFNFNMINTKNFSVNRSLYQPQIGSWEGTGLGYANYDSSNLNYMVDTKESIQVNTDWVSEDYNEIFKQLLVSDEIYWIYDEVNYEIKPITIKTSNLTFKTGVVDKVIQYAFEFDYGQSYKLII